jgi:predicted flavoprotein YhiN
VKDMFDIVVLGAGASGLMFASQIDKNLKVAIVDANSKIAKKLKISGGGRCNITNIDVTPENYVGDMELLNNALESFSKDDLLEFLSKNGI